jgi:hypothetical protein
LCFSIRANVQNVWHDNPYGARTEADRLILADICSRVLFTVRVFEENPQITPEQFLLLQLTGGQDIIEFYWWAVSNEAITDIGHVLHMAFSKIKLVRPMRFAIDEAQLAASEFLSESNFHFLHENKEKGARGLLYKYCRLVRKHMPLTQLIVAGTHITAATTEQLLSDLGKPLGRPIVFPVLTKADVRARLSRVLNTTDLDLNQVTNLGLLVGRCRWCATVVHALASRAEKSVDPQRKTKILNECIDTCIEPVVETMEARLSRYLRVKRDVILERLFAVFTLLQSRRRV